MHRALAVLLVLSGMLMAPGASSVASAAGQLRWHACPPDLTDQMGDIAATVECGTFTVPESRARTGGPTVDLAMARLRPKDRVAQPDPILVLHGGPGGGALDGLGRWLVQPISWDFEIILVDQRGGGRSRPLLCPDLDTDWENADARLAACAAEMTAAGRDPAAYTAVEIAADMADLRRALEIRRWTLFGESYGTLIAQLVATADPDGVRALVLDGPVLADGTFAHKSVELQTVIGHLFNRCAADAACAARFPDLRNRFEIALTHHGSESAGNIVGLLRFALYREEMLGLFPGLADSVARGDLRWSRVLDRWAAQDMQEIKGPLLAISCAHLDTGRERAYVAEVDALTRPVVSTFVDGIVRDCDGWPVREVPLSPSVPKDIPVLITAGGLDPVTPASDGERLLSTLPKGQMLVVDDGSHVVGSTARCAADVIRNFLRDPDSYAVPLSCPADRPLTFRTDPVHYSSIAAELMDFREYGTALLMVTCTIILSGICGAIHMLRRRRRLGCGGAAGPGFLTAAALAAASIHTGVCLTVLIRGIAAEDSAILLGIPVAAAPILALPWLTLGLTALALRQWIDVPQLRPATRARQVLVVTGMMMAVAVTALAARLDLMAGI